MIPAGRFLMGSPEGEPGRDRDEGPQRWVDVPLFAMGKFEVTQGQWQAVMGSNPSRSKNCGLTCPVDTVSWIDAQEYTRRLTERTGQKYRLPSEAEWEYAARAGTSTPYTTGLTASRRHSNFGTEICCHGLSVDPDHWLESAPVGSFLANPFGLYDMQGNVREWVQDVWTSGYSDAPRNASAITVGMDSGRRVLRGGSWNDPPIRLRSAFRISSYKEMRYSTLGLRVARDK